MHYELDGYYFRKPEPSDLNALYAQKNDAEVANLLGGFSTGYSRRDLEAWLEFHRTCAGEVLWVIASREDDRPVGHVGLYEIDHRCRSAEFAIMIGDRTVWGHGVGRACTQRMLEYGFLQLNLNRISLHVLSTNERAIRLYTSLGFVEEGKLREAQFKNGRYIDVIVMSMLKPEFDRYAT